MSDDIDDVILRADRGPQILTIDLERVPGRTKPRDIWDPRDAKRWNYWPVEDWESLPRTVCFTAKWNYAEKPQFVAEWQQRDNPEHVARRAWDLIDMADIVVTYNGDRADLKWLRTEWTTLGWPDPRPVKSVDLFKLHPRWSFERKSLGYLLERLSMATKEGKYNAEEARAACAGNRAAQKALRSYNINDVVITERLYLRLRHLLGVNLGAYYIDATDVTRCPHCGEADTLKASGWYHADVQRYGLLTCSNCGGHARNNHVKAKTTVRGVK